MAYLVCLATVILSLHLISPGNGARILIVPLPAGSHIMNAQQVNPSTFKLGFLRKVEKIILVNGIRIWESRLVGRPGKHYVLKPGVFVHTQTRFFNSL